MKQWIETKSPNPSVWSVMEEESREQTQKKDHFRSGRCDRSPFSRWAGGGGAAAQRLSCDRAHRVWKAATSVGRSAEEAHRRDRDNGQEGSEADARAQGGLERPC